MNISKKEKYLLGILITIFIGVVYYQFIYTTQVANLNEKKEEKAKIEEKYNRAMKNIKNIKESEEKLEALKVKVSDKSRVLYPGILQEKIILELDQLLNNSQLSGNIAFSPIEIASVEGLTAPEVVKEDSTFGEMVKKYNGTKTKNKSNNNTQSKGAGPTSEQLNVAINFTGSYDSLKKFILSLEEYNKKILISNITISSSSEYEVSGTMNLEFYGIPKITEEDSEYLIWTLKNVYGKEIPFSKGSASGAYNSTVEEQSSQGEKDFVMMLKSSSSELPTLTLGKAKDDSRESYIYSDESKTQDLTIEFEESDGEYYYKFTSSSDIYPSNNLNIKRNFQSDSEDIVLEITSEERLGDDDKAGVKLNIINNITKDISIVIKNDDVHNPRVSVKSKGNTVNITKK